MLDELRDEAARRRRARRRRRLDRRTAEVAREHGAEVLSFGENRGLRAGIAAGYGWAARARLRVLRPRRRRRPASGRRAEAPARARPLGRGATSRSARASSAGDGYEPYRYEPEGIRRLGTGAAAPRRCASRSAGRSTTRRAGSTRPTRRRCRCSRSRTRAARPRCEALLRLDEAGLRVAEVPVDMRERASGESKLQGKKALVLVVTVIATLLGAPPLVASRLMASARRRPRLLDAARRRAAPDLRGAPRARRRSVAAGADAVVLSGWARRPPRAAPRRS